MKTVKKKRERQEWRMVHDRSEWQGFSRENTTVVSSHGDVKPLNGGSHLWSSLQLKGIKGKIVCRPNGGWRR